MNPNDPRPGNTPQPRPHTPDMDSTLPPNADVEERFNQFWRENGGSIFIAIIIGAVIIIGAQTWRHLEARAEHKTQDAFASAVSSEQLVDFAQSHSKHYLAGAAYMKLGEEEYAKGQYLQAGEHYAMAKDSLAGTPFAERAQLGVAMCELLGSKPDAGLTDLRAIMDNPDFLEITRAEAAFNLALHYYKNKDYKSALAIIDVADTFGEKNIYAELARNLRHQIPSNS